LPRGRNDRCGYARVHQAVPHALRDLSPLSATAVVGISECVAQRPGLIAGQVAPRRRRISNTGSGATLRSPPTSAAMRERVAAPERCRPSVPRWPVRHEFFLSNKHARRIGNPVSMGIGIPGEPRGAAQRPLPSYRIRRDPSFVRNAARGGAPGVYNWLRTPRTAVDALLRPIPKDKLAAAGTIKIGVR